MFRKNSPLSSERWNWDARYVYFFLSTVWVFGPIVAIFGTWGNNERYLPGPPFSNTPTEPYVQPFWAQILATVLAALLVVMYVVVVYRLYLGHGMWQNGIPNRTRWLIRGLIFGLASGLAMLPYEQHFQRWPSVFIFVVITWTLTSTPDRAFSAVIVSLIVSAIVMTWQYEGGVAFGVVSLALILGFMAAGYVMNQGVITELYLERSRVRDQAITEERFRLARDLHDTVGHSMTQITLKAQLARKLLTTEPIRATAELTDIEQLSRALSTEIRHSIAGDVAPTLAIELDRAAELLSAAGVQLYRQIDASGLSEDLDALFGWVVREGTLNVIKHSAASRCEITLTHESDGFILALLDNGASSSTEVAPGQGLTGLRQRAEAVGGSVHWQQTDSGFTLEVRIPAA